MLYIILGIILALILLYLISQQRPKNYPPGPYGLPILGHLVQLGPAPFLTLMKWKEKYGPIVSVNFGSYRTVAISDYTILREALSHPGFSGRPNMNVFLARSRDVVPRGLVFTEGHHWKEQRRFTLRQLRDFGYARSSVETLIQEQTLEFKSNLKKDCGHPISIRTKFHAHIIKILWSMIGGDQSSNEEVTAIFKICTDNMQENPPLAAIGMFVPWIAKLFPKLSGLHEINKDLGLLWKFFGKQITDHKNTFIHGQVRDFMDAYIQEIYETTDPSSSFFKGAGERSMMATLLDLFFAGGETTANTLHWTCLYLAVYPNVQVKLHNEIKTVVGHSRMATLGDESNMPYTSAVIQEALRITSLLPISLLRNTTQDVELRGYKIPKDTMVVMNFYSAHHDKEYWTDPAVFRPERFLDNDGKLIKHDPLMAFGGGKRACIGETLSRNQLFLWITSLFQEFEISTDPENPTPSLEPILSWVLLPPDHKLTFTQRKTY